MEDGGGAAHIYTDAGWAASGASAAGVAFWEKERVLSWHEKEHAQSACHAEAKTLLAAAKNSGQQELDLCHRPF